MPRGTYSRPNDMKTTHQYYIGDARRMTEVGDESVHLVVTSPPYWQLKNYDDERQIGYNQSYEEYVNHLNLVWEECARAHSSHTRFR